MRKKAAPGFTLIEIVFTMTLVVILAVLSLWTLRPANSKAPSRGLASALVEEFAAARQLAISSGRPVALGIPVDGSPLASNIYRLEGWNKPTVTWSKGFTGDYPNCAFAAARWSGGGTWTDGTTPSVVSKLGAFDLMQWLPDTLEDDYIYCFTPDGGLVTNEMPALNGEYMIVVGQYLDVSAAAHGVVVNGAKDPLTVVVSPYGAVEVVTGLPGGSVPVSSVPVTTAAPVIRNSYAPGEVRLSNIKVQPKLGGADDGFCVPGQYVTLEVYAYDPEGRGLFAKWKQGATKGIFTYPDGGGDAGSVLVSEVDRMEYVNEVVDNPATPDDDVTWTGAPPPPGGLFRARWGFTVPQDSVAGAIYEIEVDVKDAKGECTIVNPPPKITMEVAPAGRIIAEKYIDPPGIWQFVQMNPDGTNFHIISPPGVEETLASLDSSGTRMAFLQGQAGTTGRYVKVRALDGGFEQTIAGPGNFTSVSLSPNGTWISFREQTVDKFVGELHTRKVDGTSNFSITQRFNGSVVDPARSRSGWTQNSEILIYEYQDSLLWRRLDGGASGTLITSVNNSGLESLYAPTTYMVGSQERVVLSLGNNNPILISGPIDYSGGGLVNIGAKELTDFKVDPTSPHDLMKPDVDGFGGSAGSSNRDDGYPNVGYPDPSSGVPFLVLNRSHNDDPIDALDQTSTVVPLDPGDGNFKGPPMSEIGGGVRRAIWIPAKP